MARRSSSRRPILCAVLDGDSLRPDPRAFAALLFSAGVDWIQLRDRSLEGAPLLAIARELVAARDAVRADARGAARAEGEPTGSDSDPADASPRVLVNKRGDVALSAGADGIHLGMDAVDALSAQSLLRTLRGDAGPDRAGAEHTTRGGRRDADAPGDFLIGASFHSVSEIEAAVSAALPLAYGHLAPIWSPRSKPPERPELGLGDLARAARVAARAGIRILAQGGLDAARATEAVAAGAGGVAVTGILHQTGDPAEAARTLRRALDRQAERESGDGDDSRGLAPRGPTPR